jgi:hypothetical protein
MRWRGLSLVLSGMLLTACATLQQASAGEVGCPANEITISNHETGWNTSTWLASCRGKDFVCSSVSGQKSVQVSCNPAVAQPDATATAVAASGGETSAASGCQYDTQCKGDRVCRAGQCVDTAAPTGTTLPIAQPAATTAPDAPAQTAPAVPAT